MARGTSTPWQIDLMVLAKLLPVHLSPELGATSILPFLRAVRIFRLVYLWMRLSFIVDAMRESLSHSSAMNVKPGYVGETFRTLIRRNDITSIVAQTIRTAG